MTIYTFPSSLMRLGSLSFTLLSISAASPQSAFNPLIFTDGPTSEFWQVGMQIILQEESDWRELAATLRKLRGRRNKIRLFDTSRSRRGVGGASPTLNVLSAGSAGDTTLSLTGLTASQAQALAADDMIGIGENLYAISDDAASDSSGTATVNILPPLRQGVAGGDAVNTLAPTGLFQLTDGANAQTIGPPLLSQPLSLTFIEDPDFG